MFQKGHIINVGRKKGKFFSCKFCLKRFYKLPYQSKNNKIGNFCSLVCLGKYRKSGKELYCFVCGEIFYKSKGLLKRKRIVHLCSRICVNRFNSINKKGKPSIKAQPYIGTKFCMWCGKNTPFRAVVRDKKQKFCSKTCSTFWKNKYIKINYKRGKDSHSWRGGITPENRRERATLEFRLWREAVFARDNWTCQKTGIKGGKLHPHHIQNFSQYPNLRFIVDNGITFSDKSHREFHKKYGIKNNTREQLEIFCRRTV